MGWRPPALAVRPQPRRCGAQTRRSDFRGTVARCPVVAVPAAVALSLALATSCLRRPQDRHQGPHRAVGCGVLHAAVAAAGQEARGPDLGADADGPGGCARRVEDQGGALPLSGRRWQGRSRSPGSCRSRRARPPRRAGRSSPTPTARRGSPTSARPRATSRARGARLQRLHLAADQPLAEGRLRGRAHRLRGPRHARRCTRTSSATRRAQRRWTSPAPPASSIRAWARPPSSPATPRAATPRSSLPRWRRMDAGAQAPRHRRLRARLAPRRPDPVDQHPDRAGRGLSGLIADIGRGILTANPSFDLSALAQRPGQRALRPDRDAVPARAVGPDLLRRPLTQGHLQGRRRPRSAGQAA